jgi:ABC-type sugar transport system ATPase subunit
MSSQVSIRCESVSRHFGGTYAVTDVNLDIATGQIHALVGANGAGKSTLLGMMGGRIAPSDGSVAIEGRRLIGGRPRAARALGISVVYQELTIVPALSACANVFLGDEMQTGGILDESAMRSRYLELCERFEVSTPPDVMAGTLSVAAAQMLEIMRAVQRDTRILLLDEPTAALSHRERDFLLGQMRRLKEGGVTMVFVTHNLEEVLAVSDTISVMRNSRMVRTSPAGDWNKRTLVEAMTGDAPLRVERGRGEVTGEVALSAQNVEVPGILGPISLEVRSGEVLGVAGLVGAGRTTLLRALVGAEPTATGEMTLRGGPRRWPRSPRDALRGAGIALLPEDRKKQGLVLGMSIPDNVTLTDLQPVSRFGMVGRRAQLKRAKQLLEAFKLNRAVGHYAVGELSGGNQQKVVLAKWLNANPDVMLIDEPTRGVDVAAKVEVLHAVREFARQGKAVVLTSAEIEEVLDVSDRILVLKAGQLVATLDMHQESPTERDVLNLAFEVAP